MRASLIAAFIWMIITYGIVQAIDNTKSVQYSIGTPYYGSTDIDFMESTPTPTPTFTPTPTPTIKLPTYTPTPKPQVNQPQNTAPVIAANGSVQELFIAGWYAGGGSAALLPKALRIINCESGWNVYARNGKYTGLGQWDNTWWSYGGGDIYSPWQQGHNMAVRVNKSGGFGAWECQ